MEVLDVNFGFFNLEWLLIFCLMLVVGLLVIARKDIKILRARLELYQAILDDNLNNFLKVFHKMPRNFFKDNRVALKAVDFLSISLTVLSFPMIYLVYKKLNCFCRPEVREIFGLAFSKKKAAFWASNYYWDYIDGGKMSKDFEEVFEEFETRYLKEVWVMVYRDLKVFQDTMLHSSDKESLDRISKDIYRIKILLG